MVNATNPDGKQFRHNKSGRQDGEKLQDEGSTPRMNRLEIKGSGLYGIQDHTSRSTTNNEYKYPQVRKTGVDAVHESCPQMVYII